MKINASMSGYFVEIQKLTQMSRQIANRLVDENGRMTFGELTQIPSLVIKDVEISLGQHKIKPNRTRTVSQEQRLEWLYEHNSEFDPRTGEFVRFGAAMPSTVKSDNISSVSLGIPKLLSRTQQGVIIGYEVELLSNGLFSGVFIYDN